MKRIGYGRVIEGMLRVLLAAVLALGLMLVTPFAWAEEGEGQEPAETLSSPPVAVAEEAAAAAAKTEEAAVEAAVVGTEDETTAEAGAGSVPTAAETATDGVEATGEVGIGGVLAIEGAGIESAPALSPLMTALGAMAPLDAQQPEITIVDVGRESPSHFSVYFKVNIPREDMPAEPTVAYQVHALDDTPVTSGTETINSYSSYEDEPDYVYLSVDVALPSIDFSALKVSLEFAGRDILPASVEFEVPAWPSEPSGAIVGPGLWGIGSGGKWGDIFIYFSQTGGTLTGVSRATFVLEDYPATIGEYGTNHEDNPFKAGASYLVAGLITGSGWEDWVDIPSTCTQVGTTVTMTVDLVPLASQITGDTTLYLEYMYIPRFAGEVTASVYFDETPAASETLQGDLPAISYPNTVGATYTKGSDKDFVADIHAGTQKDSYIGYDVLLGTPEVMNGFLYTYQGGEDEHEEGNGFWSIDTIASRGSVQRTASNTILTVKPGFLDTLPVGSYILRVHYQHAATGFYDVPLTIADASIPQDPEVTTPGRDKPEYVIGTKDDYLIRIDKDFALYDQATGITVDGRKVPGEHYTVSSGSTIVTIKAAYLESLGVGTHTVVVPFTDGTVVPHEMTVRNGVEDEEEVTPINGGSPLPRTGDSSLLMLVLASAFAALGIGNLCVRREAQRY